MIMPKNFSIRATSLSALIILSYRYLVGINIDLYRMNVCIDIHHRIVKNSKKVDLMIAAQQTAV